jgi:hypothetical protein
MGGEGLVSVRMPRSLLSVFRASAERQGYTIHKVAAELTCALTSLTLGELKSLREPPHEIENPRVTLNVTWGLIDILSDYTRDKVLTNSSIFRRLIYGLLIDGTVKCVQAEDQWELRLVSEKLNKT